LEATRDWLYIYKIPAGKKANAVAFEGQFKDQDFAYKVIFLMLTTPAQYIFQVIEQTHESWKQLMQEKSPKLNT
jgi:hypothetical protein